MLLKPNWKNEFTKSELAAIAHAITVNNMLPADKIYIRFDGKSGYYYLEIVKGKKQQSIMLVTKMVCNTARLTKQLEDYLK